jgi:hypothetical protein
MPVNVQWDNPEKTIILQQYEGDVSVDEYLYVINRTFHMIASVPQTVHLIYDRTRMKASPPAISRVFQVAGKHITPNLGMKIIVGANHATMINLQLCKVVAPELAKNIHLVSSLTEARQIIAVQDIDRQARV